jgi:hypothetical protein
MPNEADEADRAIEANLQAALHNAKGLARQHPFTGICRNCDEPVPEGAFCPGGECRDD